MFITFHGKLEDSIQAFYENLAEKDGDIAHRNIYLALAKENKKHKDRILRAYREIITDALEGGFPIFDLNEKDYALKNNNTEDIALDDILNNAIDVELKSIKFCDDASKSINGLIVEVSQEFEWLKKRKAKRLHKIQNLLYSIYI